MDPLMLTVKASAKLMGLNRGTVAILCQRGEIGFIPAVRPDGTRSRVHKRIPRTEVDRWIANNIVRTPEEFKRAVDGRRK